MGSGTRVFVKILIAVVSYGIAFALAFYAVNQILNGHDSFLTIVILIIIAIFGFRATKGLPFFYASGEEPSQSLSPCFYWP